MINPADRQGMCIHINRLLLLLLKQGGSVITSGEPRLGKGIDLIYPSAVSGYIEGVVPHVRSNQLG